MPELHALMTGPSLGESPRSYDGTSWFPDMARMRRSRRLGRQA